MAIYKKKNTKKLLQETYHESWIFFSILVFNQWNLE